METVHDLVIIGAGPAGVEAAIQAHKAGLRYLLIEQQDAGSLIENTMAQKKFYHVYGRNTATLKGDLPFPDRSKGIEIVNLWKARVKTLTYLPHTKIFSIQKKENNLFEISTKDAQYYSKKVLLTSGTFENHRKLHLPGEANNPKVFYSLDYYEDYVGKKVVVIGGGNSALETAIHLADNNNVIMIIRGETFAKNSAENNLSAIQKLQEEKKVEVHFKSSVTTLNENTLTLQKQAESIMLPYDMLFVHIGFEQPFEFLESIGIAIRDNKAVHDEKFETNIPGLFIAGSLTGADSVIESANQSYDIIHLIERTKA